MKTFWQISLTVQTHPDMLVPAEEFPTIAGCASGPAGGLPPQIGFFDFKFAQSKFDFLFGFYNRSLIISVKGSVICTPNIVSIQTPILGALKPCGETADYRSLISSVICV